MLVRLLKRSSKIFPTSALLHFVFILYPNFSNLLHAEEVNSSSFISSKKEATKINTPLPKTSVLDILDSLVNSTYFSDSSPQANDHDLNTRKKRELSKYITKKTKSPVIIPLGTSTSIVNLIHSKKVCIGMSKDYVLLSWGKPNNINKSIGRWGTHEQWVYGRSYLYFENGILTSMQTSE